LDQLASLDAAGSWHSELEAEVIALDPGRNSSRLRWQDQELSGTYFPDACSAIGLLCMRAEELRHGSQVEQASSRYAPNCCAFRRNRSRCLEFFGGIFAEVAPKLWLTGK
jgi:hypothetical protein